MLNELKAVLIGYMLLTDVRALVGMASDGYKNRVTVFAFGFLMSVLDCVILNFIIDGIHKLLML